MRDYIHVDDLASGHLSALANLNGSCNVLTLNLGTGCPNSVLKVIRAFERAAGAVIPFKIVARRAGDLAAYYADPRLAELNWDGKLNLTYNECVLMYGDGKLVAFNVRSLMPNGRLIIGILWAPRPQLANFIVLVALLPILTRGLGVPSYYDFVPIR